MKKIGTLILAIGLVLGFSSCKTETEEVTLEKIEITAQPSKTEYLVGEELDTTGLEVTATYSDESTKDVTAEATITGYDKEKAGEQTVTVSYTEEEVTVQTTYKVTVREAPSEPDNEPAKTELTKIELTTAPTKTKYFVGDSIELAGLKITATYTDGTTADVTDKVTTSGFDSSEAAESQTVTVTYEGKTVTFTVTIIDVLFINISPIQPTKYKVYQYQEPDKTGLKITAGYTDGTTKVLEADEYTIECDSDNLQTDEVKITYGRLIANYPVDIIQLNGIGITTNPDKMEYHIGEELDLTGIVLTLYYNDGTTPEFSDLNEITATGFDSTDYVNDKEITVTYNEKTDTFKINVVFSWFETPKQLPAGTNGTYGTEGTYVYFGVWPQDVVPVADVAGLALDENATTTIERGSFKFVKGTDGNYYVKCAENASESGYKYEKDDSDVEQGGTTYRWFKVMPIKWRVADSAYKDASGSSQGKLLVAENILTANVPYYDDWKNNRTIGGKTVYPNNYMHSQIRAYLNGFSYQGQSAEQTQWNNKGFLQTAFTSDAINKIITTKVDNSEDSTTNYDTQNGTITKATDYACDPTDDKIFLLSEYEVTKYSKSTEEYNSCGTGNSRIRVTTDFAKANNAYQSTTNGYGGYFWLRSPYYNDWDDARIVSNDGSANLGNVFVYYKHIGVVPALSILF